MIGWIILGLVVLAVLFFVGIYNQLVQLRNQVRNGWSQMDVQLKRRHDLIPNLVETAKGYATHERETLQKLTEARGQAVSAESVPSKAKAESELSSAISRFMLVVENYPDLKANTNFLALQEELSSTENKIAFARQSYNDQVLFFNNKIEMFPSNVVANGFGFKKEDFFELEDRSQADVPKVDFS